MAVGKQNLRANWNSNFFQLLAFMFLNTADCRETCVLSVLLTSLKLRLDTSVTWLSRNLVAMKQSVVSTLYVLFCSGGFAFPMVGGSSSEYSNQRNGRWSLPKDQRWIIIHSLRTGFYWKVCCAQLFFLVFLVISYNIILLEFCSKSFSKTLHECTLHNLDTVVPPVAY